MTKDKRGEAPFSVDANLLHTSSEGKVLEDPFGVEAPEYVYMRTVSPMEAPDEPTEIAIGFESGDAVSINGDKLSPAELLTRLNELGRKQRHRPDRPGREPLRRHEVARGLRNTRRHHSGSRRTAAIESITLDRGAAHLKDELMPRYAELIYNGFWFAPEREMLQAAIDASQTHVTGEVRLKLYKGNVMVTGRESPRSLYSEQLVTFEDDAGAYDQGRRPGLHQAQCPAVADPRQAQGPARLSGTTCEA